MRSYWWLMAFLSVVSPGRSNTLLWTASNTQVYGQHKLSFLVEEFFFKGCKVRRGREKMGWRSRRSWGRSGHEYDQNRVYENFKELIKFLYIYIYLKGLSRINGLIRMMSDSRCWNLRVFVHNYFIHSLIHSTKTFLGVEEADTALVFSTGWAWIRSYISSFRFHSP